MSVLLLSPGSQPSPSSTSRSASPTCATRPGSPQLRSGRRATAQSRRTPPVLPTLSRPAPPSARPRLQGRQHMEREHLLFRDYLRAHPAARDKYAKAKKAAARAWQDDRWAYTEAKTGIILDILDATKQWAQKTGWNNFAWNKLAGALGEAQRSGRRCCSAARGHRTGPVNHTSAPHSCPARRAPATTTTLPNGGCTASPGDGHAHRPGNHGTRLRRSCSMCPATTSAGPGRPPGWLPGIGDAASVELNRRSLRSWSVPDEPLQLCHGSRVVRSV